MNPVHATVLLEHLRHGDGAAADDCAMSRIDHPGIARVYEAGAVGGRPFLALELARGRPFTAAAAGQRLNERLWLHRVHEPGAGLWAARP